MATSTSQLPVELAHIIEFLQQTLPFNELEPGLVQQAASAIQISYHAHSETFHKTAEPMGLRILRSGAVDIRDSDNKLLDRLGEGESFHIGGLNAERGEVHAIIIEDALIYLLPDSAYRALRTADRDFDRYFSGQRSRRLRRAARYEPETNTLMREVRSVMSTEILTAAPQDSIQQVAQAMSARRVSSVFIMENDHLSGIVTDRDLRERCVAAGLASTTHVSAIMTPNPHRVLATTTLFETTLEMTQKRCHHLAVMEGEQLAGVVTTSDLILARQDDPVYLVRHIARQENAEGITAVLKGLPNLMVQWVKSGVRPQQVSRILTAISDATTIRLIQLAEAELGPAPGPWSWVAFGSQARGEQLLGGDQDNGIIIADSVDPSEFGWYEQVAQRVCTGLNACGYVFCPGGIMAMTDTWRQPLQQWQATVERWTRAPTPDAVMRVSIFFDLRSVYGDSQLVQQLQHTMLNLASRNTIFQAALAANALDSRPPLGIFRRFVVDRNGDHRDNLDLKKRGVLPITEIARLHALAHAIPAINTTERIEALAQAGQLALVDSRNLADALHCVQLQRLRHQCEEILAGDPVSNFINPRNLPKLAREQLRDAFTIIDEAQGSVRQNYRGGLG